ncbi:MAG: c-type cytochrome biogenesis protein CcsB [Jatrophihabitans sp.]
MSGVNGSMAHLSDGLFTTAIATYTLAMVGYTAEYAFGRVGRTAAEKAAAPRRQLVGAGGPSVDAPGPSITRPAKRPMAEKIGRLSVAITALGLLVQLASLTIRAVAVDAVPWSNMYEFASVAGLVAVISFLVVMWRAPQIRHLGGFILLPVVLLMFLAGTVLYSEAQPLVPALQSYWLAIHVVLISISEGALMTSAVMTVLYLIKSRHDRLAVVAAAATASSADGTTVVPRRGPLTNLAERLPSAQTLDKAAYRIVAFSFPLYTVAVICGSIWAEAAWGRYWGWDPKETWAFIGWVIYACYLHARATAGWKGNKAAWINLLGFSSITFNFLIINLVVSGLHSYAGIS